MITVTVSPSQAVVITGQVQTFTATVGGSTNITVTNWPCTYSYTPPPTTAVPNPTAKTGTCASGGTLPGGTGTFGTWVISTTNGSNVLTYTAPTLANFPNPVPVLTFTATSDADTKKTGTATIGLDSGIRVSVTPTTATVPVGLNPAQKVTFQSIFSEYFAGRPTVASGATEYEFDHDDMIRPPTRLRQPAIQPAEQSTITEFIPRQVRCPRTPNPREASRQARRRCMR